MITYTLIAVGDNWRIHASGYPATHGVPGLFDTYDAALKAAEERATRDRLSGTDAVVKKPAPGN